MDWKFTIQLVVLVIAMLLLYRAFMLDDFSRFKLVALIAALVLALTALVYGIVA